MWVDAPWSIFSSSFSLLAIKNTTRFQLRCMLSLSRWLVGRLSIQLFFGGGCCHVEESISWNALRDIEKGLCNYGNNNILEEQNDLTAQQCVFVWCIYWFDFFVFRVNLRNQKRLAASVLNCGKRKIWLDPNEVNEISNANSRKYKEKGIG